MLILPLSHAESVIQRRSLTGRERWMIRGVLGLVGALAAVLVISLATAGHRSSRGCVSVGLAYSTGGAQLYRCGASARQLCQSVNRPGGTTGGAARSLTIECRKARLPVG